MILESFWQALETSALGDFIASSEWAFPTIETLHVIAIVTVLGTIAIMDMRLLRINSRDYSLIAMSRDTLRLTWGAFVLAAITGSLLFVSKASTYIANPYFLAKMVFLGLAGLNMAAFHSITWPKAGNWDFGDVPTAAKVAGALSLLLWLIVAFCGRVIGFTLGIYGS